MRRSILGRRLFAVGMAVGLLIAATWILGVPKIVVASQLEVATSDYLNITATDFMFTPNETEQIPTNATIHVVLTDGDMAGTTHTFTVWKNEGHQFPAGTTDPSNYVYGTGQHQGNLVNVNVTGSGARAYGNFSVNGSGWYEFVCSESGHFTLGMYGFLAFGENLPPNLTVGLGSTGAGLAVFIIVGTIVSLTVIAIVLGFVVGRRRGSEFEMPPERLGYAEPVAPPPAGPLPPSPPNPPK